MILLASNIYRMIRIHHVHNLAGLIIVTVDIYIHLDQA
jgi:hypothetical protein